MDLMSSTQKRPSFAAFFSIRLMQLWSLVAPLAVSRYWIDYPLHEADHDAGGGSSPGDAAVPGACGGDRRRAGGWAGGLNSANCWLKLV